MRIPGPLLCVRPIYAIASFLISKLRHQLQSTRGEPGEATRTLVTAEVAERVVYSILG